MKKIFGFLLQGLLYLGPIALTIYIIVQSFNFIDGLLKDLITGLLGFEVPGLGLIIVVTLLTILGFLGQTILARPFKVFLNKILLRIPPINLIYSSLNDLFAAFVGKEKKFTKPVLVRVNNEPVMERIGFITGDNLENYGLQEKVAVDFPFSYAISGELMIVSRKNITSLHIPPAVALKFIVSGGVTEIDIDNE